jgi:hypothetical protein
MAQMRKDRSKGYFATKATGLNADLRRHADSEKRLMGLVESAESDGDEPFIRSYRNLLWLLRQSKAEVANRIGKKNPA